MWKNLNNFRFWSSNSKLSLLLFLYIFVHYSYIFVLFSSFLRRILQFFISKKEMEMNENVLNSNNESFEFDALGPKTKILLFYFF